VDDAILTDELWTRLMLERRRHVYLPAADPVLGHVAHRCLRLSEDRGAFSAGGQALRVAGAWAGNLIGDGPVLAIAGDDLTSRPCGSAAGSSSCTSSWPHPCRSPGPYKTGSSDSGGV
jgi:hypothetical protein